MVSVLLYVEVALSTRICVNEYIISLAGSVTPSLVHMTVVGGEPVEVQVRVVKEKEMLRSNTVTCGTAGGRQYGVMIMHTACRGGAGISNVARPLQIKDHSCMSTGGEGSTVLTEKTCTQCSSFQTVVSEMGVSAIGLRVGLN